MLLVGYYVDAVTVERRACEDDAIKIVHGPGGPILSILPMICVINGKIEEIQEHRDTLRCYRAERFDIEAVVAAPGTSESEVAQARTLVEAIR
jgi:2-phospho-L-lactate transferase/gluconeogenesis factor (CofD/UPF0052 family)